MRKQLMLVVPAIVIVATLFFSPLVEQEASKVDIPLNTTSSKVDIPL
ncbi:hypothetical protein ACI2JA_20010 [Alkalihalobacillus sp. NPDC078783]